MPIRFHRLSIVALLAVYLGVCVGARAQVEAPVAAGEPSIEDAPATLKEADVTPDTPPASEMAEGSDEETIPQAFPEDRYLTMWDKNPFMLKTAVITQVKESFAKDWALSGISATGGVYTVRIFNKQTGKFERLKEGQDTGSEFKLVKVSYDKDRSKSKVEVMRGTEKAELTYDDSLLSRPVTVQNTMGATGAPGQAPGTNPGKPGQPQNPNLPPGAQGNIQRGPDGQPINAGSAALRPGMPGYVPGRAGAQPGAANAAQGGAPTNPNASAINPATGAPIVNPAVGGMRGVPVPGYAPPGATQSAPPPVSRRRQLIPAPIQQSQ